MFSQVISSSLGSLTSFWSNSVVKEFGLGVEYNMFINMILTETIKFLSPFITDTMSVIFVALVSLLMVLNKYGNINLSTLGAKFLTSNEITISCSINKTDPWKTKLSDEFKTINALLIKKCKKTKHLETIDGIVTIIDDSNEYIVKDKIKARFKKDNDSVSLIISSKHDNINKFINEIVQNYSKANNNNQMIFIGKEENNSFDYPSIMKFMTFTIIKKYDIKNVCSMKDTSTSNADIFTLSRQPKENDDDKKKKEINTIEKKIGEMYLLCDCKDFMLEDDIYLTVVRYGNVVKYILSSEKKNLREFVDNCLKYYKEQITIPDFKYKIQISGNESNTTVDYPIEMLAIYHNLINVHKLANYKIIKTTYGTKKILGTIMNLFVDDILINITCDKNDSYSAQSITTCILESNVIDVSKYVDECIEKYLEDTKKESDTILRYFKYLGKNNDGTHKFTQRILYDGSDSCESFDNIFNEHSEFLKKDIDKLNNKEYYKRTGLRRKKAYLFYGNPGCGKNACVNAMAYYGKRHIIDISFGDVKYNSEFIEILNLTSINGIPFKRENVIIIFDEMDIGLEKIGYTEINNDDSFSTAINNLGKRLEEKEGNKRIYYTQNDEKLSYGCILSQLDGSGNCEGVIYIGLTNHIEKIPEALRREMRLTPIFFTNLRKCDAISIIENVFEKKLSDKHKDKIPDRKINASKLRFLCEQFDTHNNVDIDEFIDSISKITTN